MSKQVANQDNGKTEYHKALSALYADVEAVKRDNKNPHFKNTFVSLPMLIRTLKPIFEKHNFVLTQPVQAINAQAGPKNIVVTRIIHSLTGFSEESSIAMPEITDPQKIGACVTYFRRFGLVSLMALEELDDDGETAAGRPAKRGKVKSEDLF